MHYAKIKNQDYIVPLYAHLHETVYERLPPGVYKPRVVAHSLGVDIKYLPAEYPDSLIKFEEGVIKEISKKVEEFFNEKTIKAYKDLRISHKMGILIHGPHGTGKTCAAILAMQQLVSSYNAIALNVTGLSSPSISYMLEQIRDIEKTPIVIFVDEFEKRYEGPYSEENFWLTFLDGDASIEDLIFIGCTNYLNKIPERIVYRKSRIKHLCEVKAFPIEVYAQFASNKLPNLNKEKVYEFAYKAESKGMSLDDFKHAIIDYSLEGLSIDEALRVARTVTPDPKYPNMEDEDC